MTRYIAKVVRVFSGLVIIAMCSLVLPTAPVFSANASDWKAGRIIDDSIFQNPNDFSIQDIQNFLNGKVPECDTWGTKPATEYGRPDLTHAQYATGRGWPGPPYVCLKDYYEVPKTAPGPGVPDNSYNHNAQPFPGAVSAAQMIYTAAHNHNISVRALLIKLATESAGPLTSDSWPLQKQYTYAMGAYCPDSGPGGAANCDANYSGFSIQINEAAGLLRWYLDSMTQPWWQYKKPYQVNSILWNVAPSGCGAGDVYIESKATAALYTYTPYQPNAAALANMYGTGNNCSAYGNRNFWRTWVDWFGPTNGASPYQWSVHDQAIYLDPARTQRLGYSPSLTPGQTVYAVVKAKNIGYTTWDSMTRLATNNPPGRNSPFFDSGSWLSPNRPAIAKEGTVSPGQIGTFEFTLKVPNTARSYSEAFVLVQDGVRTFPDIGQNFTLDVTLPIQSNRMTSKVLRAGDYLRSGQNIYSPEANSVLRMQEDGNLVLYNNFSAIWQARTSGNPGAYMVVQGDGNVVVYSKDNSPLWNSRTSATNVELVLQTDANLVLVSNGTPIWSSLSNQPQSQLNVVNPRLGRGGILFVGQRLETADRTRMLILQGDGNLVLYNASMRALWSSVTSGKPASFLVMQLDGNLVLYDTSMRPLWASGTDGRGASRLVLQDDTNLVIYRDDGRPTWATYTNSR